MSLSKLAPSGTVSGSFNFVQVLSHWPMLRSSSFFPLVQSPCSFSLAHAQILKFFPLVHSPISMFLLTGPCSDPQVFPVGPFSNLDVPSHWPMLRFSSFSHWSILRSPSFSHWSILRSPSFSHWSMLRSPGFSYWSMPRSLGSFSLVYILRYPVSFPLLLVQKLVLLARY